MYEPPRCSTILLQEDFRFMSLLLHQCMRPQADLMSGGEPWALCPTSSGAAFDPSSPRPCILCPYIVPCSRPCIWQSSAQWSDATDYEFEAEVKCLARVVVPASHSSEPDVSSFAVPQSHSRIHSEHHKKNTSVPQEHISCMRRHLHKLLEVRSSYLNNP